MGRHSLNGTDDMNTSIREVVRYFLAEFSVEEVAAAALTPPPHTPPLSGKFPKIFVIECSKKG